jgi:hypothetical protein
MIKSEPYFWVECDRCGERAEYGDFSAMADASQAVDGLDWITIRGKEGIELHYCEDCTVWSDEEDEFVVNMEPFVKAVTGAEHG